MRREAGFTIVELLAVLALASAVIVIGAAVSMPTLERERVRGSIYELQTLIQSTRMEAVKRNHACRFLLHSDSRRVLVVDGLGTPSSSDDQVLIDRVLPEGVSFATPDGSSAITLKNLGSGWSGAALGSDGTIEEGDGTIVLQDGDYYSRLSLFVGGATLSEAWDGYRWYAEGH